VHDHHSTNTLRAYWSAFAITSGIVVLQFVVRQKADSLTLLGDMIHIFSDALVYGGIVYVLLRAHTGVDMRHAKKRMIVLGIASLVLGGVYVAWEGLSRIVHPIPYPTTVVMLTALVSMVGTTWAHVVLKNVAEGDRDLQYNNFIAHLRSDIAASAIVFVSALLQSLFALPTIEGYLSLILASYMCFLAHHLWKDSGEHH